MKVCRILANLCTFHNLFPAETCWSLLWLCPHETCVLWDLMSVLWVCPYETSLGFSCWHIYRWLCPVRGPVHRPGARVPSPWVARQAGGSSALSSAGVLATCHYQMWVLVDDHWLNVSPIVQFPIPLWPSISSQSLKVSVKISTHWHSSGWSAKVNTEV